MTFTTSSFASSPLFPQHIIDKLKQPMIDGKKSLTSHQGYANFSGHWIGTCDNEPDETQYILIRQSPDSSSILMDNVIRSFDTISTDGFHGNFETEFNLSHLRWSKDGQQILTTSVFNYKDGNMSQEGLNTAVLKSVMSIENEQLIITYTYSTFLDGIIDEKDSFRCTYKNK